MSYKELIDLSAENREKKIYDTQQFARLNRPYHDEIPIYAFIDFALLGEYSTMNIEEIEYSIILILEDKYIKSYRKIY